MTTYSAQFSGTESDLSDISSGDELKIDLSYLSQKSYCSELNIENNTAKKVELPLVTDYVQTISDLNVKSQTFPNLKLSKSSNNSEKLEFLGLERDCTSIPMSNVSTYERDEHLKLDSNIASLEQSLDSQENRNFFNESELKLKINAVFSLSFTDSNNLEKDNSVSPLKINLNSQVITDNSSKNKIDHSVSETEREVSVKLVALDRTFKKPKDGSILKEKFDNSLDKSALATTKNNFTMEINHTSPLKISSEIKSRPKLKSIFFAKRKRPQFDCSFSKKIRVEPQTQNTLSIDLKESRLSEALQNTGELDNSVELKSKTSRATKQDDLQHSPSSTELETIKQSDKLGLQSFKIFSSEREGELKSESNRCLIQSSLEKEDSSSKMGRLDIISTESGSDEKEEFNEQSTKVSTKQILSPVEDVLKELLNSDSDDIKEFIEGNQKKNEEGATKMSSTELISTTNVDLLKTLLSSDSDDTKEFIEGSGKKIEEVATKTSSTEFISTNNEDFLKTLLSLESDSDSEEEFDEDDDHNDDEETANEYSEDEESDCDSEEEFDEDNGHNDDEETANEYSENDDQSFDKDTTKVLAPQLNSSSVEDIVKNLFNTESDSDEKEEFDKKATKVSTKQFLSSPEEDVVKELLNSESDSDEKEEFDKKATKVSTKQLLSSPEEDVVKELLNSESDCDSEEEFDEDNGHNDDEETAKEYSEDEDQNFDEDTTEESDYDSEEEFDGDDDEGTTTEYDKVDVQNVVDDATKVLAPQLISSNIKDIVKDLFSSESDSEDEKYVQKSEENAAKLSQLPPSIKEDNFKKLLSSDSDDKVEIEENGTDVSETQLRSPTNDNILKELSTSDSDGEEDAASMKENIFNFFTNHSREEIAEMFNATKPGALQMTLRDRCLKKKDKSLQKNQTIATPKKPRSKPKCLPQTRPPKRSKRNSLWSVKIQTPIVKKNIPELLPCGNCDRKFPSWPRRTKHWVSTKHKEPELCKWCNKSFYFVHKHIVNAHPSMCENCGKVFLDPEKKTKHSDEHEDKTIYCCDTCQFSAVNEVQLREHMETHLGNWLHICEFCEMDFVNEDSLIEHLSLHHFECHICNFQCYQEFHFNEHMMKHTEKVPFNCSICDKVFSNLKTLRYHIRGKHKNIRPYICNTCNKSFVVKNKLVEHIKTHEGNYYACETCGLLFNEERYLILHEVDHSIYICNFCNSEYTLKFNLINHLRGSSGDGFICQRCDLDCNCRTEYEKHMEMHNKKGEMTTVCQFCNVQQKSNAFLKSHMIRAHPKKYLKVNDKAEICEYCKHICSSRHHLLKHIRLKHPDQRKSPKLRKLRDKNSPYECNICGMKFKYICGYNKHLKSKKHNDDRLQESSVQCTRTKVKKVRKTKSLYNCDICNVTCTFISAFNKHLESKNHLNKLHLKESLLKDRDRPTLTKVKKERNLKSLHKCDICNVTYKYIFYFNKHLKSKKHLNELQLKESP